MWRRLVELKKTTPKAEAAKRYREKNPEKTKAAQKKWRDANKDKVRERMRNWRKAQPKEKHNESMREWRKKNPRGAKNADLKKAYGITLDQYEQKLEEQNHKCCVCGDSEFARALAVDHDHASGDIRGLLCAKCNTSLGLMRECPVRLLNLIKYIEKWKK